MFQAVDVVMQGTLMQCFWAIACHESRAFERMVHQAAVVGGAVEPSTHCRGVWAISSQVLFRGLPARLGIACGPVLQPRPNLQTGTTDLVR